MLLDYLNGETSAFVSVSSENLDMWEMTGQIMFRSFSTMSLLERKALNLCRGRVLDIGAGSGCHSLCLEKRGLFVDAVDISPGCIEVMKQRRVSNPLHKNLFGLSGQQYDTILLLMNGIGLCGSLDGIRQFFGFLPEILKPGGRVIADSTDLADLYSKENLELPADVYYGQTQFTMTYKTALSDPFNWIYVDFDTLKQTAQKYGLVCNKIYEDSSHRYLTEISFA